MHRLNCRQNQKDLFKSFFMITIGLRVYATSKIYYCLLEQHPGGIINYLDISLLHIPSALLWPESLNFVRNTILDILLQYNVEQAAIRISEFGTTVNDTMTNRNYIEGVLQETLASSNVIKFVTGRIAEFTSLLGIQRTGFKDYIDGTTVFPNSPISPAWNSLSHEQRETILVANAALNL